VIKLLRITKSLYFKSSISVALLNLILIIAGLSIRIYTILDFLKYLLLKSTLFNNYNTTYLVYNKVWLNKGNFVKLLIELVIKVKTFILLIIRHSTCTFKGLFNKRDGKRVNLVLCNIVIIKGFYINIVLKAFLFKKSV
jgi:hypothetical protein